MGLGGVNTSPCLIPVRRRLIAPPARSCERRNSTCRPGRTKRRTYSSRLRLCETIPSMRAQSFGTNKNSSTRKRLSPQSKRRAFGMDVSTTAKLTRVEQCQANAKKRSEQKRQAVLIALAQLQREKRTITKAAVARQAGVSLVFLRSPPSPPWLIRERPGDCRFTSAVGGDEAATRCQRPGTVRETARNRSALWK